VLDRNKTILEQLDTLVKHTKDDHIRETAWIAAEEIRSLNSTIEIIQTLIDVLADINARA